MQRIVVGTHIRIIGFVVLSYVLLCCALSRNTLAEPAPQTENALLQRLWIGVHGGPNTSWIGGPSTETDLGDYSSKLGFALAASARLELTAWLAVQSQVSYVTKGTDLILTTTGAPGETRLSYLAMPLLVWLQLPHTAWLTPHAASGLEIGWLLGCESILGTDEADCSHTKKALDLGLAIGAGVSARMPWNGSVVLSVRYVHGLSNSDARDLGGDYRNRSVLFSIGYYHHLGAPVN